MKKPLFITSTLLALLAAASGFGWYASASPQHRKPSEPAAGAPAQPRPAPQATPREPRDGPDHQRPRPRGGPVVVYPGWPWWGYPYPYPYGYPPGPWRVHADWATATLRIDVSPSDAEVYVDRFYAGPVDHFDGIFQHLTLHAGPHFIEIRKTGFRILVFEVNLYPGESMTYRQTMTPATEGDRDVPAPAAPGFEEGAALPSPFDVAAAPGEVRFDVTPRDAAIYADGFYAGLVSDFDDTQHLLLPSGRHHVSFTLDGYESLDVDLSVESARTMTYRGSLKKSK